MLAEPTFLGGIFFVFVVPGFLAAVVAVVVTAVAIAINTPTRASFVANLLLGAAGYIGGMFIGFARAAELPRDHQVINESAVWGAVLLPAAYETLRWWLNRRRRARLEQLESRQSR